LPKEDREVYSHAGYGGGVVFGKKPAVVIVDVTYAFVGDRPEPILKSIERFPNSCGEIGWASVFKIRELLEYVRSLRPSPPVIYTAGTSETDDERGRWNDKNPRYGKKDHVYWGTPENIVREIAPKPSDLIIAKSKPSAFHGTEIVDKLASMGIDTLLVTGCTTSGCVRATVIDAFSYDYRVGVVQECVFDRGELSHKVNLFDMNEKYANVLTLGETKKYLGSLDR
jgi:maleamate amidohydrolase